MRSVAEIKKAIKELPKDKRQKLSRWLVEEQQKAWDEELENDAKHGRLQFLIDEAESARKSGKLTKFP